MRKLGYALLVIGFAWISLQQLEGIMRAALRPVVLAEYAKLSPDPAKTYTREDVQLHIRETALATYGIYPPVIAPGVLMLIGGLILALSSRARMARHSDTTHSS